MSTAKYNIGRVISLPEFVELKEEWEELVDRIPDSHLTHTWDWLNMWWRHHQSDGELWLLVARDASNDILKGIFPLMLVASRIGPLSLRMLTFLFYRPPIHQIVIAMPDERSAIWTTFVDYLYAHSKNWDILRLDGFLTDEEQLRQLKLAQGQYYEREAPICHVIRLPQSWKEFEKDQLSANRRKQLRRARRKLENDFPGQVVFEQLTDVHDIKSALEVLVELNRQRWHEKGIKSSFDENRFVEFHREMSLFALEKGWLRFYRLTIGADIGALRYSFCYRNTFYDYQLAFNLKYSGYRPGEILLAHVLAEVMREGITEFDMLRGTYRYKRSWSNDTRYETHLVKSRSWRGHIWVLGARLSDTAIYRGREILSDNVRKRLNQVVKVFTRSALI